MRLIATIRSTMSSRYWHVPLCALATAALLAVDRVQGVSSAPGGASLHLDEHDDAVLQGDDVDLPARAADIAGEDPVAASSEAPATGISSAGSSETRPATWRASSPVSNPWTGSSW